MAQNRCYRFGAAIETEMKTIVIIQKGWETIAEYDFLLPLSKGDVVADKQGFEYRVDCLLLDLSDNTMKVLVK